MVKQFGGDVAETQAFGGDAPANPLKTLKAETWRRRGDAPANPLKTLAETWRRRTPP